MEEFPQLVQRQEFLQLVTMHGGRRARKSREIPPFEIQRGRYCLNDFHKAAGGEQRHQPRYWLANQQTQELVSYL